MLTRTVNNLTTNEIVELTMLWATGSRLNAILQCSCSDPLTVALRSISCFQFQYCSKICLANVLWRTVNGQLVVMAPVVGDQQGIIMTTLTVTLPARLLADKIHLSCKISNSPAVRLLKGYSKHFSCGKSLLPAKKKKKKKYCTCQ